MQSEYVTRRKQLMQQLKDNSVIVVFASNPCIRNADNMYPFRQNSDFLYLTNFREAAAIAVLIPERRGGEYILFCNPFDEDYEIWCGSRPTCAEAVTDYKANQSYPISAFEDIFPALVKDKQNIYWTLGGDASGRKLAHLKRLCAINGGNYQFFPAENLIHEMRLRKSPLEIKKMQQAALISSKAHTLAMSTCKVGMYEYEIESLFLGLFRTSNAVPAYPVIVGGGSNACILHYTKNDDNLRDGDLLLIDAGAEYDNYASDITRTFPINGRFSSAQKELYEVVLEAQESAIQKVKIGNCFHDIHQTAVNTLVHGLLHLGLLKGRVKTLIKQKEYLKFYMHNTGHWIGLDVHDTGEYYVNEVSRNLEEGMVLTVEPGLYIRPAKNIDKRWWNIGIRIEDDVLVTSNKPCVLSEKAVKTVAEIESLMAA